MTISPLTCAVGIGRAGGVVDSGGGARLPGGGAPHALPTGDRTEDGGRDKAWILGDSNQIGLEWEN